MVRYMQFDNERLSFKEEDAELVALDEIVLFIEPEDGSPHEISLNLLRMHEFTIGKPVELGCQCGETHTIQLVEKGNQPSGPPLPW